MGSFLDGFEKRMETVGIVEFIVNRKNRHMELEKLFKSHDFLNLVFSVLLFIMEKTLSEDGECGSEHIQTFIKTLLTEYYDLHLSEIQLNQLTQYILKNVLQNEGETYHFETINYAQNERKKIMIRLIADHVHEKQGNYKISYSLTDQGYDFLFRTKEVDQEIKLTIEELKLKELIKRKNFKKAYDQSQNLIQMVRQKKKEIQLFMMKIQENIHDVDIEEFEHLMSSTFTLLNDEYELLADIMSMSRTSEEKIRQEYEEKLSLDESLKKAQTEIKKINHNIKATLSEQKDLILSRQNLSKAYIDTIGESFAYSMENRFNMEDLILTQMEDHAQMAEQFWKLVNPLFLPNNYKTMNIRSIYDPQGMIKLKEEKTVTYIETEELLNDDEQEKIQRTNKVYIEILDCIFHFALQNGNACNLAEIISALKTKEDYFSRFTEDRLLFTTLLKLYDIGVIDVAKWRNRKEKAVMNLSEEFNIEFCLHELLHKRDFMNQIEIITLEKSDDLLEIEVSRSVTEELSVIEKIEISNFMIKVESSNE